MAKENFEACLAVTLPHEGGWADHPKDPGGATMKGVTLATFQRYKPGATKSQLRAISDKDLQHIYRDGYWDTINGDRLPYGVDLATFDYGVNSGPSRAAKYLQAAVGAAQDGAIGPKTLVAVVSKGGKETIQRLCAKRLSFVRGLKTWSTFGRGWSRRIADVEAKAVVMWMTKGAPLTASDRDELRHEGGKAASKAKKENAGAGAASGGGAAGTVAADLNWILIGSIAVLVIGVVVFFVIRARQNKDRAEAYEAAAA